MGAGRTEEKPASVHRPQPRPRGVASRLAFLYRVARSFVNAACRMLWTVRKKVDRFSSTNLYHGGILPPGHVQLRKRGDGIGATIDRAGMTLSLSCGLHCTFTPLLIGLAASLPIGWLLDESTEVLLLAAAVLTGALSLGPCYWRRHRRKRCVAMFAVGAGLLVLAKLGPVGERWEPWTVASGATLLATAHLVNLRLCRQCARCEAEEPFA